VQLFLGAVAFLLLASFSLLFLVEGLILILLLLVEGEEPHLCGLSLKELIAHFYYAM
jgi:hypothetical protein